jgi:2-polyprenyl-3-methyl-5-hydroxy-6-metoxy-1,4-benzoquinol methylase
VSDYFVNHARVRQFPWALYHAPIERDLAAFLRRVCQRVAAPEVLVIGCGTLAELDQMPHNVRVSVVDIDPRAVDAVLARKDPRVVHGQVVEADGGLAALGRQFDAIYAKEVIEHVVGWCAYLGELRQRLAPLGELWLSTPNYGEPWLAALECTVLEAVARAGGFTRHGMHPSRFSRRSLAAALAGAQFEAVHVRRVAWHLALVAHARAPAE